MRLLIVSDIHGNTEAVEHLREEAESSDLILLAGDLTHFGGVEDAARVVELFRSANSHLKAVAGNCDNRDIEQYLAKEGLLLDQSPYLFSGVCFLGLSGALPGPVSTPYETSEEALARELAGGTRKPASPCTVLVSHQPPFGSIADRAMKVKHVGSRSLRTWIESEHPGLVICGHIHESFGRKHLGESLILNPGALKEGRYATAGIDSGDCSMEVELRTIGR